MEEEDKSESVYFNLGQSIQILSGQKIHQSVMISSKEEEGREREGMTMSKVIHHDQLVVARSGGVVAVTMTALLSHLVQKIRFPAFL